MPHECYTTPVPFFAILFIVIVYKNSTAHISVFFIRDWWDQFESMTYMLFAADYFLLLTIMIIIVAIVAVAVSMDCISYQYMFWWIIVFVDL